MSQSETPRLDAAIAGQGIDASRRVLELCRKLERELQAAEALVWTTQDLANQRESEMAEKSKALASALEIALLCIDDAVNLYAPEMCDPNRVEEARARHAEGGTLHYYAAAIAKARTALAKAKGQS